MKLGRRQLLSASLGAAQMALLGRLASPGKAHADVPNGPTKLLTIFLEGGWMSPFVLIPWSDAELTAALPTPVRDGGEPVYCTPAQVRNLDGTTAAGRIRVPVQWDAAELSARRPDRRATTSPHGWSWVEHRLWENACILHGVDQGTVAHAAGQMSAICGIASSELKAPAINAVVADRMYARFPDRPVPSVWIGGPFPGQLSLRSEIAPVQLRSQGQVDTLLSDRAEMAWAGVRAREIGSTIAPLKFDGSSVPDAGFVLNPLENQVLRRMRQLRGTLTPATRSVVEELHDSMQGVSKLLARDVATRVERTVGFERTPIPFWAPPGSTSRLAIQLGSVLDTGLLWDAQFDFALKLLKSDACTSVGVNAMGANQYSFDGGHTDGHKKAWTHARGIFEIIGRLLGEMKATRISATRTLLDDTLVLVLSDFARTMPKFSFSSDHWATNTVIMAGGGMQTNKSIGGYVIPSRPPAEIQGHDGAPVAIRENGQLVNRVPRSADVITTALEVMGIGGYRITGGNGAIEGVKA